MLDTRLKLGLLSLSRSLITPFVSLLIPSLNEPLLYLNSGLPPRWAAGCTDRQRMRLLLHEPNRCSTGLFGNKKRRATHGGLWGFVGFNGHRTSVGIFRPGGKVDHVQTQARSA